MEVGGWELLPIIADSSYWTNFYKKAQLFFNWICSSGCVLAKNSKLSYLLGMPGSKALPKPRDNQ